MGKGALLYKNRAMLEEDWVTYMYLYTCGVHICVYGVYMYIAGNVWVKVYMYVYVLGVHVCVCVGGVGKRVHVCV